MVARWHDLHLLWRASPLRLNSAAVFSSEQAEQFFIPSRTAFDPYPEEIVGRKAKASNRWRVEGFYYRDRQIRTADLSHPKRARYQAAPYPGTAFSITGKFILVK
jgi:hypothetical protein